MAKGSSGSFLWDGVVASGSSWWCIYDSVHLSKCTEMYTHKMNCTICTLTVNSKKRDQPLYTVGRNVNWYSHYGEQYALLLLSCFSRVQLCVTPETAAHQASPSLGFSRQEHWSGLPFPSPMHESEK